MSPKQQTSQIYSLLVQRTHDLFRLPNRTKIKCIHVMHYAYNLIETPRSYIVLSIYGLLFCRVHVRFFEIKLQLIGLFYVMVIFQRKKKTNSRTNVNVLRSSFNVRRLSFVEFRFIFNLFAIKYQAASDTRHQAPNVHCTVRNFFIFVRFYLEICLL